VLDALAAGSPTKSINFVGMGCPIWSARATIIAISDERLEAVLPAVLCSGGRRNSCDLYDSLKKVKQVNRHCRQRYLLRAANLERTISLSVGNTVLSLSVSVFVFTCFELQEDNDPATRHRHAVDKFRKKGRDKGQVGKS